MKTVKTLFAVILLLLVSINIGYADLLIDSTNYSIEIGDFMGQPNSIVRMPVRLKNEIAIGAFFMPMEYDTSLLTPVGIGFENDSISWDSVELVNGGWNTIHIDSTTYFPLWDTSYSIYATNNKYTISLIAKFIPPFGAVNSNIPINTGAPSTIFNLLFHVNPDAPVGQSSDVLVINDPDSYQHVELSDSAGLLTIIPGNGPLYATATFQVGAPDCGDINIDGNFNILDIVSLINYLYLGGYPPTPQAVADINHSGTVNILDVTYYINFLYNSGPAPDCPPY